MITNQISAEQIQREQVNFINKVYAWMSFALIVTGLVAMWVASNKSLMLSIFENRLIFWGLIIAEFACVAYLVGAIEKMSAQLATSVFIGYSALNGLTFSIIFAIYTMDSIASTFFITAGTFAVMSIYGYYTKRDLTSIGNLAIMGLIGVIIASVVNWFMASAMLYNIITYVGVLVFVALIAYDTQKIKNMNIIGNEGTEEDKKEAIMGALRLYLDFINLFLFLLRIFGRRK
jgi:FtsH-binding integral membrane protein